MSFHSRDLSPHRVQGSWVTDPGQVLGLEQVDWNGTYPGPNLHPTGWDLSGEGTRGCRVELRIASRTFYPTPWFPKQFQHCWSWSLNSQPQSSCGRSLCSFSVSGPAGHLPILLPGSFGSLSSISSRGLDLPTASGPSPGPSLKESFLQSAGWPFPRSACRGSQVFCLAPSSPCWPPHDDTQLVRSLHPATRLMLLLFIYLNTPEQLLY